MESWILSRFGCEVDGTGSELCPVAGSGVSNVEFLGSTTRESVMKIKKQI